MSRNIIADNDASISTVPEIHRNKSAPAEITYDQYKDVITIDGLRFAREIFSMMAREAVGTCLRIISRKDGVVTFERVLGEENEKAK